MASFLVIVLVKRKLLTSKWILLLSFSLWVYYYTRTIFAREDDIFTNPVQTTYILGYNWGIMHILAQKAFPNIILQMAFEIIVFILRMVVFVDGLSTQQLINHILVNLFLLSSNFWTDSQNRKYYKETFKFKEFMGQHLPSGVVILNNSLKKVLFSNQAFDTIFEYKPNTDQFEILKNIRIEDYHPQEEHSTKSYPSDESVLGEYLDQIIKSKNGLHNNMQLHCSFINSKEEKKIFEVKIFQLIWDSQKAYSFLFNDISYREALISLKMENQNQEKALATVAHEMRNPINGLLGIVKLMEKISHNPKIIKCVSLIQTNISIMLSILNSILDIEQLKKNKLQLNITKFDVSELLENIHSLYEFQLSMKNLQLFTKIDFNTVKTLNTDKNRLNQIIINLVANALKFTKKGSITISVGEDPEDPKKVMFRVTDTGIGIKPEDCSKLFQTFGKLQSTSKINPQGVGLGLMISNSLVKVLNRNEPNNQIKVESEVDKGSTFYFSIYKDYEMESMSDIVIEVTEEADIKSEGEESEKNLLREFRMNQNDFASFCNHLSVGRHPTPVESNLDDILLGEIRFHDRDSERDAPPTMKALVVDDDIFNFIAAKELLKTYGFTSYYANDGGEVLPKIEKLNEESVKIDLILMDCEMPLVDGFEAASLLKKKMETGELYKIPIIGLSGNSEKDIEEKCLASGMDRLITKPITDDKIQKVISVYKLK